MDFGFTSVVDIPQLKAREKSTVSQLLWFLSVVRKSRWLTTVLCCTGCTYTLRASGFERVRKSRIVVQYQIWALRPATLKRGPFESAFAPLCE